MIDDNPTQGRSTKDATMNVRAMVAGRSGFYPTDPQALRNMIDHDLEAVQIPKIAGQVKALICPHAGYVYSGQVAAWAYSTLVGRHYDNVIILGPSHYMAVDGAAVMTEGMFATPFGDIPINSEIAGEIIDGANGARSDSVAHEQEHSIEVQAPFLKVVLDEFSLVPIAMGMPSMDFIGRLAMTLREVIQRHDRTLLIASSDMSHYHPYSKAVEMDHLAIEGILSFDPDALLDDIAAGRIELCGAAPVLTVMSVFAGMEDVNIDFLKYQNSGDITGDKAQVVGYCAFAISRPAQQSRETHFSREERELLLKLARDTIKRTLNGTTTGRQPELSAKLSQKGGAFVTLKKDSRLRGCIGYTEPIYPLAETVEKAAVAAALQDPRFPAVTGEELDSLRIEISALTPLRRIEDIDSIEVGEHGLVIEKGLYKGLLLPQVAMEEHWTREEFLDHTCIKAGLPPGSWRDEDIKISVFSAEVFGEDEV